MILDTIAMVIGYIVIACIWIILMVIIFAIIAKHQTDLNEKIYRREYKKRYDVDPHFDITDNGF